jgi:hypothetical protein
MARHTVREAGRYTERTRRPVIGAVRHRWDRHNGREFRHFDESARDLGDERHEAEEDENHQGANAGGDWSQPIANSQ